MSFDVFTCFMALGLSDPQRLKEDGACGDLLGIQGVFQQGAAACDSTGTKIQTSRAACDRSSGSTIYIDVHILRHITELVQIKKKCHPPI